GPEWNAFADDAHDALWASVFQVDPASNRMGVRLRGAPLRLRDPLEMISSPVTPGTIQVPPDGNPIILGVDAQTVGGYPRIAHVLSGDLPLLAQTPPGGRVRLRAAGIEEAHTLLRARVLEQEQLAAGVR